MNLRIIPLTLPQANRCVAAWHRHHAPLPGGFAWFCLGCVVSGSVVGAAVCGRPTNRNNDDGQTVEVLRIATDGTRNACSKLLSAAVRVSEQMGAARVITYTLDSEGGASLRASSWDRVRDGIRSWWTHAGTRIPAVNRPHMAEPKTCWQRDIRAPIDAPALPKEPERREHPTFSFETT